MTKYVFMTAAMFAINASDGACPSYHTHSPRFNHIGGSLLFRLLTLVLNKLQYFGSYKLVHVIGTDSLLAVRVYNRNGEVDWSNSAVGDRFVSYYFSTGAVYGLRKEVVQAKMRVRDVNGVSTTVTVEAVRVIFRTDVSPVDMASIRQDYVHYR